MDILESKLENLSLIAVNGRLDTLSAGDLEKKMDSLIGSGCTMVIIDLEKTEYISSSGLRVLLASLKKVRKQQGDIMLARLAPDIIQVFEMSGFDKLFNIFESVEAAAAHKGKNTSA